MKSLTLQLLDTPLTVCKLDTADVFTSRDDLYFLSQTDEECSLVCPTTNVPLQTLKREDGWRALRVVGTLEFSLIGILAHISNVLATAQVGIFVVSTFNTDYVLVKETALPAALNALDAAGYVILS